MISTCTLLGLGQRLSRCALRYDFGVNCRYSSLRNVNGFVVKDSPSPSRLRRFVLCKSLVPFLVLERHGYFMSLVDVTRKVVAKSNIDFQTSIVVLSIEQHIVATRSRRSVNIDLNSSSSPE